MRRMGTQRSNVEGKCNVTAALTPRDTSVAAMPALWTLLWAQEDKHAPSPLFSSFPRYTSVLEHLSVRHLRSPLGVRTEQVIALL